MKKGHTGLEIAAMQYFNQEEEFTFNTYKTTKPNPEKIAITHDLTNKLSFDGKLFFKFILDIPSDAVDSMSQSGDRELLTQVLIRYFHQQYGWSVYRARKAMTEVKDCLHACIA